MFQFVDTPVGPTKDNCVHKKPNKAACPKPGEYYDGENALFNEMLKEALNAKLAKVVSAQLHVVHV